jgi:hypothetical protein
MGTYSRLSILIVAVACGCSTIRSKDSANPAPCKVTSFQDYCTQVIPLNSALRSKDTLTETSAGQLKETAEFLKRNPAHRIQIEGHFFGGLDPESNLKGGGTGRAGLKNIYMRAASRKDKSPGFLLEQRSHYFIRHQTPAIPALKLSSLIFISR